MSAHIMTRPAPCPAPVPLSGISSFLDQFFRRIRFLHPSEPGLWTRWTAEASVPPRFFSSNRSRIWIQIEVFLICDDLTRVPLDRADLLLQPEAPGQSKAWVLLGNSSEAPVNMLFVCFLPQTGSCNRTKVSESCVGSSGGVWELLSVLLCFYGLVSLLPI